MNSIRVRCDACGKDNSLPVDRVWLHPPVTFYGVALYTFDCEHCQHHNQRPADRHVVRMLTAVGVHIDGDPVGRRQPDRSRGRTTGPTMKAALVTGSRHWTEHRPIWDALYALAPDLVIEGKAPGADAFARSWAQSNGTGLLTWPDNHWGGPDHVTGPIRNGYMVSVAAALVAAGWDVEVLAFPDADSRGTWSCVNKAKAADLKVRVWDNETGDWS